LKKLLKNPKKIDDLATRLSKALLNLKETCWKGEKKYYDELMLAVENKGKVDGNNEPEKDGGKGGNPAAPRSLGESILLFGVLPLSIVLALALVIYFLVIRKKK
jgi:hypothetical protein